MDGNIIVWKIQKLQVLQKLQQVKIPPSTNGLISMAYLPYANTIAVIDTHRKLSYVSLDNMQVTQTIEAAYDGTLTTVTYNDQRDEVAVGDDSGEIKVFSNSDGRMLHLDTSHGCAVTGLCYSPDGSKLMSGDIHGKILVWQVNNSQ